MMAAQELVVISHLIPTVEECLLFEVDDLLMTTCFRLRFRQGKVQTLCSVYFHLPQSTVVY